MSPTSYQLLYPAIYMVPVTGLEPVQYRYREILSLLCLPIPPHRQLIRRKVKIPHPVSHVKGFSEKIDRQESSFSLPGNSFATFCRKFSRIFLDLLPFFMQQISLTRYLCTALIARFICIAKFLSRFPRFSRNISIAPAYNKKIQRFQRRHFPMKTKGYLPDIDDLIFQDDWQTSER